MAHASLTRGIAKHDRTAYMIRAKLFRGLQNGTIRVGSLFADVKELPAGHCCYCGAEPPLSADHLLPRKRGGTESGDNLVWACTSCNSRKSGKDLLVWYAQRGETPPLALLRRYLKLAMAEVEAKGIGDTPVGAAVQMVFSVGHIPTALPEPAGLMWIA
jgi:hypothetical protein